MAKYGLVAGKESEKIKLLLKQQGLGIEFERLWSTTDELQDSIINTSGNILADYAGILVLDFAYLSNIDTNQIAEEIVSLENAFMTHGLQTLGVKLYVVTKNSDAYKMLQGSVMGIEGNYYPLVHILLTKSEYKVAYLKQILEGKYDTDGIFNKEALLPKSLAEINRETGKQLIEDSKLFDEELLKTGDESRVAEIRDVEFIDSKSNIRKKAEEERKEKEKEREIEIAKRRGTYVEEEPEEERAIINFGTKNNSKTEETTNKSVALIDPLNIPESEGRIIGGLNSNVTVKKEYSADEKELIKLYQELKIRSKEIPNQKLEIDRGSISFVGERNSGTSGVVAQTAELYASFGRKVLIIDLDIETRSQTIYFPQYDELSSQKIGSIGLLKAVQGVDLKKTVVSVTSGIDLLSLSRVDNIPSNFITTLSIALGKMIKKSSSLYDIVLLDIPLDYFEKYIKGLREVQRNVFVVKNTEYYIENLFALKLASLLENNETEVTKIIRKSSIILNQFRRGLRDEYGYELTTARVKKLLADAGAPFDSMLFSGELPYYDDWEVQFSTNLRYIWKDIYDTNLVISTYKSVVSKILI